MLIWLIFAAMLGAVVLAVLRPLGRREPVALAASDARALYESQLHDIARDLDRGVISGEDAELARAEAARRLIRAARSEQAPGGVIGEATYRRRRVAAVIALSMVPLVSLALYGARGSPHLPGLPLSARMSGDPAAMDMGVALARVENHLALNPTDGRGWELLGPVYMRAGRYDDAMRAYANAAIHLGPTVDRLVDLAEARALAAGGVVTAEARATLDQAAKLGPLNPKGRFYLAVAREQDGDRAGALADLRDLLTNAPADAPWRAVVTERIARLDAVPPGGEAIAALPEPQRNAMIAGMVDALAERLDARGGTADEWARLVRSQAALGQGDRAAESVRKARTALAADPAAIARVEATARESGVEVR